MVYLNSTLTRQTLGLYEKTAAQNASRFMVTASELDWESKKTGPKGPVFVLLHINNMPRHKSVKCMVEGHNK